MPSPVEQPRIPFNIPLPADLHERLARQAKREERSAAGVIRFALRKYLDAAEVLYLDNTCHDPDAE